MTDDNKRTTKEYKIIDSQFPNVKIKYGTLDRNNPEIIYIRSKARVTPLIKQRDYYDSVTMVKNTFGNTVHNIIKNHTHFENRHICSIEMSENGISFGKKSYIKYDIYVKPKKVLKLNEYELDINNMVHVFNTNLSNELIKNNIKIL